MWSDGVGVVMNEDFVKRIYEGRIEEHISGKSPVEWSSRVDEC